MTMADEPNVLLPQDELERSIFVEFLDESMESLTGLDAQLLHFEEHPDDLTAINAIFRPVHSVKGNSAFFGLMRTKKLAHELESLLDMLRKNQRRLTPDLMAILLKGFDALRAILQRVREGGVEVSDVAGHEQLLDAIAHAGQTAQVGISAWPRLVDHLDRIFRKLSSEDRPLIETAEALIAELRTQNAPALLQPQPDAAADRGGAGRMPERREPPAAARTDTSAANTQSVAMTTEKTLRISEKQLDAFLAYVGELLVVGEMFNHLAAQLGGHQQNYELSKQFNYVNETFATLSNDLQRSIMALRCLPLKPILGKAPRLAHDVAVQKGKQIRVLVEDNELSVDKSLHDMLDAPLTHIVRNAADHGIELPDVRKAAGKPVEGTIRVTASEVGERICIEIVDDGAGLNIEALKEKGVAAGIIAADREPGFDEIVQVLFMPGISTSREITDISGRGVGMDVVKRAIEAHGGMITVASQPGNGSTFTILLNKSVSTQILSGFLVRVASNVLVLPMDRVLEVTRISGRDVTSVSGKGRCIQRHGQLLPLLNLCRILHLSGEQAAGEQTVVVVNANGRQLALGVDDLVGVQQVVVKPITGLDGMLDGFSGGALMGDGNIALIVDLDVIRLDG
jgi:two-component system chemotaxis sensor kinase CheA